MCDVAYIYVLKDPETFDIRYVGQTKNYKKRKVQHRSFYIGKNHNHYNMWKISLKDKNLRPLFEIIEEVDIELIDDREIFWIDKYLKDGCKLVNSTSGGEGNLISEKHNSKALKGKTLDSYYGEERAGYIKNKISENLKGDKNPNYNGATCTEEWKENQIKSQSKKPLLVYKDNILIGEFRNSKETAKFLNCSPSAVRENKKRGWKVKGVYTIKEKELY